MVFVRPLIRYADFNGRARRMEYFGFAAFQAVLTGLPLVLTVMGSAGADKAAQANAGLLGLSITGLIALALFVPQQAVLARRLHDSDRSAKWMWLQAPAVIGPMVLIFGVIAAIGTNPGESGAEAVMSAVGSGILLVLAANICNLVLFVLTLLPGTSGDNRFGGDPRDGAHAYGGFNGKMAGIDEERLDALFAEARGARVSAGTVNPVDALQRSVFDFGPPSMTAEPPPVDPGPRPLSDWREDARSQQAPVFGRRVARPA